MLKINVDGSTRNIYQYRITEWRDENNQYICFFCNVMKDGQVYGEVFEARNHEQAFAWLRLVMGAYPGMFAKDVA